MGCPHTEAARQLHACRTYMHRYRLWDTPEVRAEVADVLGIPFEKVEQFSRYGRLMPVLDDRSPQLDDAPEKQAGPEKGVADEPEEAPPPYCGVLFDS